MESWTTTSLNLVAAERDHDILKGPSTLRLQLAGKRRR